MPRNEKYVGNVLLQKTFVEGLFSGKQVKNHGELARILIQNYHPALISRESFETVSNGSHKKSSSIKIQGDDTNEF